MFGLGVDERYSTMLYIGRIKSRRDSFLGNIGDAGTRTP